MIAQGHIDAEDWSHALGAELDAVGSNDDEAYYAAFLRALERFLDGLAPEALVRQRKEDWRQAYLRTPHGAPVEL